MSKIHEVVRSHEVMISPFVLVSQICQNQRFENVDLRKKRFSRIKWSTDFCWDCQGVTFQKVYESLVQIKQYLHSQTRGQR